MIVGESGTGKEFIAKAIHERWEQYQGRSCPFVALNCAGLTESLVDSQLFGHSKGSFTGATNETTGLIASADGGTLFLDEFGEIPPYVQYKLLRVLEDQTVRKLGSKESHIVAFRLITATSDPRFAAFAGYTNTQERLKGQWRSEEEMSRPLRSDLLFRVKGQTIRATPVTEENVDRIVRHAIATKSNSEIWSEDAVRALVGLVRSQISAVEGMDGGDGKKKATATAYKPVFGHRREIDRFIRLIEAYRVNAEQCGSRSRFKTISRRDVEFIYRPSSVVEPGVKGQDVREPQSPSPNAYETACRRELQDIVKIHAPTLESGWTPSQLECLVKNKALSEPAEAALKSFFLKHPEKPPGMKTRATDEAKGDFLKSLGYSPSDITTKTTNKLIKRIQDWRKDWRAKK